MRILRAAGRIGLAGVVLLAAARELFRPAPDSAAPAGPARERLVLRTAVLTLVSGAVLALVGGVLVAISGVYNLAADRPHFAVVRWVIETGRTRSVRVRSQGIPVPNLHDPSLYRSGFALYRRNCQPCHGAPGVAAEQIGRGINPKPPQLAAITSWNDAEIYWIVSHGLRMSGMPGFAPRLSDRDRWAIVAIVRRLGKLSAADYQLVSTAVDQGGEPASWGVDDDRGFAELKSANPERGRQLMGQYGCIACHTIPPDGHGQVGPSLTAYAERAYIAGSLVNLPTNTVNFIVDPQQYKPKTAMPNLGVPRTEALDMASYLYTLGSPRRIQLLQP